MNLPLLSPQRVKKLKNIARAAELVYQTDPKVAAFEALLFISDAFLVIYRINLFGRFLDETVGYVRAAAVFDLSHYLHSKSFFFFLALFGLWLVANFFSAVRTYLNERLTLDYQGLMPAKIMAKLAELNMGDVEGGEFQDLLSKVQNYSIARILDTYWRVRQVVYHLVKILSAAFFVSRINPLLAVGVCILVLPEILYKYQAKGKVRSFVAETISKQKHADAIYAQAIRLRNFPELKASGVLKFLEESRAKVLAELGRGVYGRRFDQYIHGFIFSLADQVFFRLLLVGVVIAAVVRRFTAGTLQALFQYMINLYDASLAVCDRLSIVGDNAQYVGDYFDFINFAGFGDVSIGERTLPRGAPEVQVVNLSFCYPGRDCPALAEVNLRIAPGEKVAVVGADGVGKTTLVKLLCGLYKIEEGDILYNGISVRDLRRGELKGRISSLFEDFIKYDMSIRKNILLSDAEREHDQHLYRKVLAATLLDAWLEKEGLSDTQILGRVFGTGMEISAGHWGRIAIARTLYRARPVIIMDEPLIFVDSSTRGRVFENLLELVEGRTLIVTLHSLEDVRFFDRAFAVEGGRVSEIHLDS